MGAEANKDIIEEIRIRSDIVESIGRYVPLKKASGHRFKAVCPFHKEKTPSFHVDADKQLFHCFGCGASGDVFSFIMQYENVSFPEAARILADRAGIAFDPAERATPGAQSDKAALYELHEALAKFYADTFEKHPQAEIARRYLEKRNLLPAVKDFQIGFAPPATKDTEQWAKRNKFPDSILNKAGILLPSNKGGAPYDRFRGRLIFPIRNEQGRVVGFSGRILDNSSQAKYINSPETPLFHKSRLLYGLDRARQSMVESRRAILCEGQIDVIRCHLAGCTTAVAPQGTALTEAHALLLKRYADEVVIVFDADNAGQNAALKGAEILLHEGLTVRIAQLPQGEDPDTLISKQGAEPFNKLISEALSIVEFHVAVLRERGEFDTQAGRLRSAQAILQVIQHAPSAVQREQYLMEASRVLDIGVDALRADIQQILRPTRRTPEQETKQITTPSHPINETTLIEIMLAHPEVLNLVSQYVPPEAITDTDCRTIMQSLLTLPDVDEIQVMRVLEGKNEECRRLAARLQMTARTIASEETSGIQAAQDIILRLRINLLEKNIRNCSENLKTSAAADRRRLEDERANMMVIKKNLEDAFRSQSWKAAVPIFEFDH